MAYCSGPSAGCTACSLGTAYSVVKVFFLHVNVEPGKSLKLQMERPQIYVQTRDGKEPKILGSCSVWVL